MSISSRLLNLQMAIPESEVRDGPTKILSLRRWSIATGHGKSMPLKTDISYSAKTWNRYNLPLYWFSNQFSLTGWNTGSSLIAVGLVCFKSDNCITSRSLTPTDLAAIIRLVCSRSTARLCDRRVYGQTWSAVPYWLVSTSYFNNNWITASDYIV